ncbi:MAG: gliding motility-associated C-terminal domain-containing protein [Adhaeribacter sp.]
MKKLFLLGSMFLATALGAEAQVYFSQDFGSTTDYKALIGKGGNLFNNIEANGNNKVAIVNGKLQLTKNGGSGTNRASFTRSTANPIGPAGFLKYSLEVTVSGNDKAVPSGFQFAVGEISNTAPAAPGITSVHSLLVVNPADKAGEFTLVIGTKTSKIYSGTQTLVWYINNTGKPVGYTAPDGSIASLPNDANSLWVVSGSTAELAIDRQACETPTVELKSFKLSSNPNFVATLDVDNLHLSEEPIVIIPEIVSVQQLPLVTVPMRTSLTYALPKQLEVTYDNGNKAMADILWAQGTEKYNGYRSGRYPVVGTIRPVPGTINPLGLQVETIVEVRPDIRFANTFTPDGDGKNDTWLSSDLKYYRNVTIEVFDRDGVRLFHTNNPEQGWDGKNQYGKVVKGSYFYVVQVPTISLVKKGVVTIVKE